MGHAGAIISGGKGTADEKIKVMKECGIMISDSPADIGRTVQKALEKLKSKSNKKPSIKKLVKQTVRTISKKKPSKGKVKTVKSSKVSTVKKTVKKKNKK